MFDEDPCETPKSPPGDYNPTALRIKAGAAFSECETPKSPPGDYNGISARLGLSALYVG